MEVSISRSKSSSVIVIVCVIRAVSIIRAVWFIRAVSIAMDILALDAIVVVKAVCVQRDSVKVPQIRDTQPLEKWACLQYIYVQIQITHLLTQIEHLLTHYTIHT